MHDADASHPTGRQRDPANRRASAHIDAQDRDDRATLPRPRPWSVTRMESTEPSTPQRVSSGRRKRVSLDATPSYVGKLAVVRPLHTAASMRIMALSSVVALGVLGLFSDPA